MLIGLSLSRCVRDIVEERVIPDNVLVIISRTNFDPTIDNQWKNIWIGYTSNVSTSFPEWAGLEEDRVHGIVLDLWNQGKIHQPRKFGAHPRRLNHYWLEVILPISEIENIPSLKNAWEQFQIIAGLNNITLFKETE